MAGITPDGVVVADMVVVVATICWAGTAETVVVPVSPID